MKYDNDFCNRFVEDMEEAGYEVEHYRGRNMWQGPSVRVDRSEEHDVIRATVIPLQSDAMGKSGLVIYPVRSGKLIED